MKCYSILYVAKCNLGKVNLELMLPAVSLSLHMICGGAPFECAGANYVQPCSLAIIAINAFVSESLRIHQPHPPFPEGYLISEVSIGLGKYFHWTSFSVTVPVSGCYWGGSRLPGCHGDLPAVPELPRALPHLLLRHQFPSSSICDEFEVLQNEQNHSVFLRLILILLDKVFFVKKSSPTHCDHLLGKTMLIVCFLHAF